MTHLAYVLDVSLLQNSLFSYKISCSLICSYFILFYIGLFLYLLTCHNFLHLFANCIFSLSAICLFLSLNPFSLTPYLFPPFKLFYAPNTITYIIIVIFVYYLSITMLPLFFPTIKINLYHPYLFLLFF